MVAVVAVVLETELALADFLGIEADLAVVLLETCLAGGAVLPTCVLVWGYSILLSNLRIILFN